MAAYFTLVLETDTDWTAAEFNNRLDKDERHRVLRRVINHLKGVASGQHRGIVRFQVASAIASQTITCDQSAATAGVDNLTVAGVAFALTAATQSATQIAIGASDAALATNTASAINTNTTTNKILVATASSDTVTVTARLPGPVGNFVTLAETGDTFTLGAATLASGASEECDEFDFGLT